MFHVHALCASKPETLAGAPAAKAGNLPGHGATLQLGPIRAQGSTREHSMQAAEEQGNHVHPLGVSSMRGFGSSSNQCVQYDCGDACGALPRRSKQVL